MKKTKVFWLCIVFSLATFSLFSQQSQDYQVTVSTVEVWVKAIGNDGKPVTGLTQADFEIQEDKKPVQITCFEEQVIAGAQQASPEQQAQAVSKKFVMFLDLFNTSTREFWSIRPHLASFLDSISHGNHEVMLAALMPNGKMGIVAPFTRDLNRIRILLSKAQAGTDRNIAIQKNLDEINVMLSNDSARTDLVDKVRDAYRLAQTYAKQEQYLSDFTLEAIEKFAQHMAVENVGDNSVVVYVSGGFSVDPGRQYFDVVDDLASTAGTTEEFMALSQLKEQNLDMRSRIKQTLGKLNKMNVTFYTIDTVGLGGASEYQDSLVEIADETGGTSFYNSQNFKDGLTKVVEDLNHQYLLCFAPPPHAERGKYHNIKVTAKKPGVELRHRRGYTD